MFFYEVFDLTYHAMSIKVKKLCGITMHYCQEFNIKFTFLIITKPQEYILNEDVGYRQKLHWYYLNMNYLWANLTIKIVWRSKIRSKIYIYTWSVHYCIIWWYIIKKCFNRTVCNETFIDLTNEFIELLTCKYNNSYSLVVCGWCKV